ncbi:NAD(P)-binding domain-containing protein [Sneathiella sp.]|uniref:NAD(P)-binding domain-containing protein n=1 Tax=Sneathiella sp. TaxID=1964365 RepID=UPI00262CA163|nr:NAD(P)/FAD-dependent oxidoreductase [Sneathiella sp.]MDF2368202.1 NAD(P)/FAD-dependent oxidoreductase [Sneathiella sp.]
MDPEKIGLEALDAQIHRELRFLNYPPDNWVKPVAGGGGEPVLDVAIIGGGMCGMAAAFGFMREGIRNFRVFDAGEDGFEGPWCTTARMKTLRSPKHLTGPNLGLPSLTFQAWYRAKWGDADWNALGYIPTETWMDYLRWYRHILEIPTENNVRLLRIKPEGELLRVYLCGPEGDFDLLVRSLVLATGRAAFGGTRLPEVFRNVPANYYAHTEDVIDFNRLSGKRLLVIGGAASAVDSAAAALENGAADVHLLMRAPEIPRLNKFKSTVYAGYFRGFSSLDDETRWRFLHHGLGSRVAAPRLSMLRLKEFDNFHIHTGVDVKDAYVKEGQVHLAAGQESFAGDFLVLGTGYAIDIRQQPELADFADKVRLWRDCFTPPEDVANEELGRFPYLGPAFEFLEKEGGTAPYLNRIHLFNAATTLSHAAVSSDIPGVNIGAERLVNALAVQFFKEAAGQHLQNFYDYSDPELLGDEWREEE